MPSTTTADGELHRCARAHRCADRDPVRDEHGDHTGEWVGAQIHTTDRLCPICISTVDNALIHLRGDIVELTGMIGRTPDGTTLEATRVKLSAPGPRLPIREHVEALRALIDHEACSWAKVVAWDAGVDWSTLAEHHSRIEHRVDNAAKLLRYRLSGFLGLGPVEHRARSLTARRGDGHDPDVATVCGDDYWVVRTGLDGALLLLELHEHAWALAGRSERAELMHLPCKTCGWSELRHVPGEAEVWCAHCRARTVWDDYVVLREHALAAHDAA